MSYFQYFRDLSTRLHAKIVSYIFVLFYILITTNSNELVKC